MTRYKMPVSAELLPHLVLPRHMRLVAIAGLSDRLQAVLVEIEDDSAPAELEDKMVSPTFTKNYDTGEISILDYGPPL